MSLSYVVYANAESHNIDKTRSSISSLIEKIILRKRHDHCCEWIEIALVISCDII